MLDTEFLAVDDWVYDCETCQYVEHVEKKACQVVSATDCKPHLTGWTMCKRPLTRATPNFKCSGF